MTDELAELLDSVFLDSVPIARELLARLEETRLARLDEARADQRVSNRAASSAQ